MSWPCEKTHRCPASLSAKVSIRKNARRFKWETAGNRVLSGWTLWFTQYDFEWDYHDNRLVGTIEYCPFCGKKLD